MRVIVCGGRDYNDVPALWRRLDLIDRERGPIIRLADGASDDVTGPYIGADYWSHMWAQARGVRTERYRAECKRHGRAAGPIRNGRMLMTETPDAVIAFPGGNGTANMIQQAREAGVEVIEVKP